MVRRAGVFIGSLLLVLWGNVDRSMRPTARPSRAARSETRAATAEFAGYAVEVTLSDRARKKLEAAKETVVVANYFYGFPKAGTPRKFVSDVGEVSGLAEDVLVEVRPGETARVGAVRLKREPLGRVDAKGPQILINVFSGRRSSKDNLLDCDIFEGSLKEVAGTKRVIACKLIGE